MVTAVSIGGIPGMGTFKPGRGMRHIMRCVIGHQHVRIYVRAAQCARAALLARKRHRWVLAGAAATAALLLFTVLPAWATLQRRQAAAAPHLLVALSVPTLPSPAADDISSEPIWQQASVQPGQSLAELFAQLGLSPNDLQRVLDADGGQSGLTHIRPGQRFEFLRGAHDELLALHYDRNETQQVTLRFHDGQTREQIRTRPLERMTRLAHGTITDSLIAAGNHAGMSNAMVLELAKVFGYDIDFAQDLRAGDSFSVVYDNVYRDGEYVRPGNIIAAEFINRGRRYTAFRYELPDGNAAYYSEDGRPMRKSFLRTPVDFTRISSRFSVTRMHPILGRMRAHKGVDYAAPTGTPIYAAGDGVVVFRGRENGYGNFVLIRHNKDISTAYGHMSRFAKGLHRGERVHQGEIIGYVGMTGLATGPHLHYEFRVDGVQRDPLTVTLPKPAPLPAAQLLAFRRSIAPALAQIDQLHGDARLASVK